MWGLLILLWALFGTTAVVQAQNLCDASAGGLDLAGTVDPCPAPDAATREVRLPLPHAPLTIVFRTVEVRNRAFWCSDVKVSLGAPPAESGGDVDDPFRAHVQSVDVFGAFETGKGQRIYLGKYELTMGQAASMLALPERGAKKPASLGTGLERLAATLEASGNSGLVAMAGQLKEASGKVDAFASGRLPGGDQQKLFGLLANPVRGMPLDQYDTLLRRYNLWCLADGACRRALGRLSAAKGVAEQAHLRLPTEVEWEYAARWGDGSDGDISPATPRTLRAFANTSDGSAYTGGGKVSIVGHGRRPTGGGFYDMLGNVQELVLDPFRTQMVRGRVGARTARGGSFQSSVRRLDFTSRTEVSPYDFSEELVFQGLNYPAYTGLRPSIGLPAKLSSRFAAEIKDTYGRECRSSFTRGAEDIAGCDAAGTEISGLCTELARMSTQLRDNHAKLCRSTTLAAMSFAKSYMDSAVIMTEARQLLDTEGLSEAARRRHIARHNHYKGLAEAAYLIYVPLLSSIRDMGEDCAYGEAIETYLTLNRDHVTKFPAAYQLLAELVRGHITRNVRRPRHVYPRDFMALGEKLSREKLTVAR